MTFHKSKSLTRPLTRLGGESHSLAGECVEMMACHPTIWGTHAVHYVCTAQYTCKQYLVV
jgi:hypothetical protein